MTSSSPSLPPEIWLYITRFIPDSELRRMVGVNFFFYDISLELRYRTIELQKFDPRTTVKLLSRLADPSIGKRVRDLTASPDFRFYGTSHSPAAQSQSQSVLDRFNNMLHTFWLSGAPLRPEEEATRAFIDALPSLSNVMAFTIDSHSWGQHSGPEINTFLNTSWTSFGSSLRKLSLRGHATSFRTIIASNPSLPLVDELFFELTDQSLQSNKVEDANILRTVLAPFINSFSSKLQALTLWAWTSTELSELFKHLDEFPLLTRFNFHTSFPKTFTIDPSGLFAFLSGHRHQLEVLVLRLNYTTPYLAALSTEQQLSEWLLATFQQNRFSRLQELQLYPSALPEGFNSLLSCIQQSAETLQRLVVRERYLDLEDVIKLVNQLPPNLRSLRLNLRELNIGFFDDLAAKLPRLYSLSLYIGHMSASFSSDMDTRFFNNWKLYNIGIWQSGSMAPINLMRLIEHSIPSIDSFWGLDTTEEPY